MPDKLIEFWRLGLEFVRRQIAVEHLAIFPLYSINGPLRACLNGNDSVACLQIAHGRQAVGF
jgi:hypothetical protein